MPDPSASIFDRFAQSLAGPDVVDRLHGGVIGNAAVIDGPFGPKKLVYADYVASGRSLRQVEEFVLGEFLPWYSNSHTEASHVGGTMTRMRNAARNVIRRCCNAGPEHAVIFAGSGATQGINRLVHLFGLDQPHERPLVLHGPYEHHSNLLPWRESCAEVIELPEGAKPGPCVDALTRLLGQNAGRKIVVALSAASNVTGLLSDVEDLTRRVKAAGAKIVWDYAGGGPYLPIDLRPAPDALIDVVVFSPHKFCGGPQASGVLVLRKDAVESDRPTFPGGGTVRFVRSEDHDYSTDVATREEAGTPNVIGDLRAALALLVKEAVGQDYITARNAEICARALSAWQDNPMLEILGRTDCTRLPIFSFRVRDGEGDYVHHQLFTRMLSDCYGIQVRGGCACAGPYVLRLLGIDGARSEAVRRGILAGNELEKPGFVRLNLSYLASDEEVDFILDSVSELARTATTLAQRYDCDTSKAIFRPLSVLEDTARPEVVGS